MKKIILILTLILLVLPCVSAAKIYGNIYDIDLNPAKNTIIKINTTPEQTFVSKDGTYSLTVNPGNYIITASYKENTLQKEIEVIEEGDYVLDLILYPGVTEPDIEPIKEEVSFWWYIGILIIIGIMIFLFYKTKTKKPKQEDELTKKVLKFIKEEGNRTTQKDIRKRFQSHSEAKISLVIAELEHKNIIKKIKKGRGNIIILN